MHWLQRNCLEDQEVDCPLNQICWLSQIYPPVND
jgi:hypothetical protein